MLFRCMILFKKNTLLRIHAASTFFLAVFHRHQLPKQKQGFQSELFCIKMVMFNMGSAVGKITLEWENTFAYYFGSGILH